MEAGFADSTILCLGYRQREERKRRGEIVCVDDVELMGRAVPLVSTEMAWKVQRCVTGDLEKLVNLLELSLGVLGDQAMSYLGNGVK